MRRLSPILLLMACLACGSDSPTTPKATPTPPPRGWPAGTVVTVTSGWTGETIAAAVWVDGVAYAGQAVLPNALVQVAAPGYLVRQTFARTGETSFTLWPESPQLPGYYTQGLVYRDTGNPQQLEPLRRLPRTVRTVSVVPSEEIRANAAALAAHRAAIDDFNRVLGGRITYQLDGTSDFTVPTRVDEHDEGCFANKYVAFARVWETAGEITRSEVVFCRIEIAQTETVAHEIGHTFGLRHSHHQLDLMYPYIVRGHHPTLSGHELVVMWMLLQRPAGNEWPDNDRALANPAASARGRTSRVVVVE